MTTDDLTIQIVTPSADGNGDSITYGYAWHKDNTLQTDLTTDTVPASRTARGEVWKCVVTPNDGTTDGASDEDSVTVANTPPVADVGGTYSGEPGEEIAFDGSGSFDADGDALTYSWTFGDSGVGSGVSPTHTYTTDGVYTVSLVVNDGGTNSDPSTKPANIFEPGQTQPMTIELVAGWNLISTYLQPIDTSVEAVLSTILEDLEAIWAYDTDSDQWLRSVFDGPAFLNSLQEVKPGVGYWVNMSRARTLIIQGVPLSTPIILKTGWNLVGFNHMATLERDDALSSIVSEYSSVWAYNTTDKAWESYDLSNPSYLNNLEVFEPGKGYWIECTATCSWGMSGGGTAAPPSSSLATGHRNYYVRTARPEIPHTIWGTVEADGVKLANTGTVILKVDDRIESSCRLGETTLYDDIYMLDIPPTIDDSEQVWLYVQINGMEVKVAPVPSGTAGQAMRFDLSAEFPPRINMLHQNYPNPFNPETWIPYQLWEEAQVEIRIYSATGQHVRTLSLGRKPAGFYLNKERAAYWDGRNEVGENAASGVYFYRIEAGDTTTTRKMVMIE